MKRFMLLKPASLIIWFWDFSPDEELEEGLVEESEVEVDCLLVLEVLEGILGVESGEDGDCVKAG
jgi:hypothetical protein